ncbi:amine oxidase [Hymenobacter caeli]|uniref:Beta-glucosidase/6-phospho-beta-glucosidase/beta-galactosidase n=1 Tax=Hymenobacter caeli TaxID=2735894 RepID=A0ABX2FN72_9BACT|nr:amine oxidase [Hymenobacter caeli]NRT18610.1 beta-glucosidase/6-phospho-beta-glucosidase/beta-galactosidase [Hymenobacter caeli]
MDFTTLNASPFQSFWWGGFECTDQLNAFGNRVDFLPLTGHLPLIDEDYAALAPFNIGTVREGIRWAHIEKTPYQYDFSTVQAMLDAGQRHGIQQVWDLCHFGYPDDLTPLHPMFARRFAALCRAFVDFYRSQRPTGTLIVTPINEVSFISWLGGDARGTSPYCHGNGWQVKYELMRAYIEGANALREADPSIRLLTTEPLIAIAPRFGASAREIREARDAHNNQFQATDILCGRMCPELGGHPALLDIVGFNYYYDNQWQLNPHWIMGWNDAAPDPRLRPLRQLLREAYRRYERPFAITETSHPAEDRPIWLRMIGQECAAVLAEGLPLWGACLYPVVDRPDWDHLDQWHRSGLWDADLGRPGPARVLHQPSADALLDAQAVVNAARPRRAPALV